MAEIHRAALFAKNIQKRAGRAKELFRQNLGKADKTTDTGFDEYVKNFTTQQFSASRLIKEIRNYSSCLKALQMASKSLMDVMCDQYEPNWADHDKIQVKAEMLETKWEDYQNTIEVQVVKPLVAYCEQFPDVNAKILKRNRKLLDYDCCRHTIESLEQTTKKKEEQRIAKAKEQLVDKQNLYESINSELMDELPALWDSRVSFIASNFQCLYLAEAAFHRSLNQLFSDMNDAVEMLANENQKGIYAVERFSSENSLQPMSSPVSQTFTPDEQGQSSNDQISSEIVSSDTAVLKEDAVHDKAETISEKKEVNDSGVVNNKNDKSDSEIKINDNHDERIKSIVDLPLGVLYQVKATYQYSAEDGDELSFDPGEVINVIEFDDPDQQEEGWLMGYKEGGTIKGLFPANFTIQLT